MIETINGYTVVVEHTTRPGQQRVILAVNTRGEYVTAMVRPREEQPTEWYWGHYTTSFLDAVEDFRDRAEL